MFVLFSLYLHFLFFVCTFYFAFVLFGFLGMCGTGGIEEKWKRRKVERGVKRKAREEESGTRKEQTEQEKKQKKSTC